MLLIPDYRVVICVYNGAKKQSYKDRTEKEVLNHPSKMSYIFVRVVHYDRTDESKIYNTIPIELPIELSRLGYSISIIMIFWEPAMFIYLNKIRAPHLVSLWKKCLEASKLGWKRCSCTSHLWSSLFPTWNHQCQGGWGGGFIDAPGAKKVFLIHHPGGDTVAGIASLGPDTIFDHLIINEVSTLSWFNHS